MSDPIRVLWLIKGLGAGGAEQLLLTQSRLRAEDIHPTIAITRPDRDHLRASIEATAVDVIELGGKGGNPYEIGRALHELLAEGRFDLVHTHSPALAPIARLVGRRNGVPTVYTEHNRWARYRVPTRLANAMTFGLDAQSIAVSEGVRQTIVRPLRRRVRVLHHGTEIGRERPSGERAQVRRNLDVAENDVVVLVVANLRKQKAPTDFVEAVRLIPTSVPARFFWVGQGPLEQEFQAAITRSGVAQRLSFLGYREDVRQLMSGSDVFCLSSIHEGLPVAAMEAMAEGLPIVATRVGGLPEAVETSDPCGILTPPGRPDLLANSLRSVIEDPELRREFGTAAERSAHRFDARRAVAQVEDIYREHS